jgi:hypothetical protein
MNDPRLDPETAERLLCGEHTSPTELAELLAAASTAPVDEDPSREEAAVAAFHDARSRLRQRQPVLRVPLTAKAALIVLLLALTGGITVVATSQYLPDPKERHHSRTPHEPRPSPIATAKTGSPSPGPSIPPTSPRHSPSPGHSGNHPKRPHKKHPAPKHPTKKPKGKASTHQPPGRASHGRVLSLRQSDAGYPVMLGSPTRPV